jgi:hypothetical protein
MASLAATGVGAAMLGIGLRRQQEAGTRATMEADVRAMEQAAAQQQSEPAKKGRTRIKRAVGDDATPGPGKST